MALSFYTTRQDDRIARLRDAHNAVIALQAALSALGNDEPAECEGGETVLDDMESALSVALNSFDDTIRNEDEALRMDCAA
ncbi:MAG: hypothetical protein ABF968_04990 [Acetobacter sp.]|uniref:hypothetical protein n=1 Tax=Acetobacter sp. TaxID=440 RepID=UPI0039ECA34C